MKPPILDHHNDYKVVREDLIAGGTKRRALSEWLPTLDLAHFSYTGSVFGYGAYALALTCHDLGYDCSIYISKNNYTALWAEHINQIANVTWTAPAPLSLLKEQITTKYPEAYFLEAGFPNDSFEQALINVFKNNKPDAKRVWISAVSATMARAMAKAWSDIEIQVVCCAKHHGELPKNITPYYAPEKYHQKAKILPPYPSAVHIDAKIWQFVEQHGRQGDIIWNLAA
ncbi:MAG: hypothetical protein JKY11_01370 [Alphaproteobacteria bacterium]|nr:hypothetical protein [Alphaproteobacteria bacterium]